MYQQKHGTLVVTQKTIRPHLEQVSHGLAAALSAIEQATGIPGGSLSFTLQRPDTDTLYYVDISEIRPPDHFYTLMTAAKVIGKNKAWVYVAWVTLFSTLAGLIYGAWVDGAALWLVALYLLAVAAVLAAGLALLRRLDRRSEGPTHAKGRA